MSSVTVTFGAKDDGVNTTIMKIKGSLENLENQSKQASASFDASFKGMAIAGAVAGAGVAAGMKVIDLAADATRAVIDNLGNALDLGGRLSDLSARTGETAGNLLILERAFDNTGIGADKVGTAVNKLQNFIVDAGSGAATQSRVLAQLGLSMSDLAGLTPTEQMSMFAQRISAIEDPTKRVSAASDVFGTKLGGTLLPVMMSFTGELKNAQTELGSLPKIMDENAGAFDAISDKIGVVRGKVLEFAAGLLESAVPALNKLVNAGSELDAAKFGQIVGQKLSEAFELITSGDIWELFRLNAEKAINNIRTSGAINNLAAFLNTVFDGITGGLDFNWDETFEKYKNAGIEANTDVNDAIDDQISALWDKQKERAAESAQAFEDEMQEAAANSAIMLKDIPEVTPVSKEIPKWLERLPETTDKANKDSESIKGSLEKGADAMSKAAADVEKAMTISQQIAEDIDKAEKENDIDPKGRLKKEAEDDIANRNFAGARKNQRILESREQDREIRDKSWGRDMRTLAEIAEDEGIDPFRKSQKELREEILKKRKEEADKAKADEQKKADAEAKKRQEEMKPGNEGKKDQPKDNNAGVLNTISSAVDAIKAAVLSLEKKLPQPSLGY
jgi:hypothetical protein